jgi:hypothetical protein
VLDIESKRKTKSQRLNRRKENLNTGEKARQIEKGE